MSISTTRPDLLDAATRLAYCGQRLIECAGLIKAAAWDGKTPSAYVRSTLAFEFQDAEEVIKALTAPAEQEAA